jgi:gas vesicle protein
MDTNIIIGASTALGAAVGGLVGGLFSLFAARREGHFAQLQREKEKLLKDYIDACLNIESFHKIEEAYTQAMAPLVGKSEQQVKVETRDKVEKNGFARPTWSARDARKAINDGGA